MSKILFLTLLAFLFGSACKSNLRPSGSEVSEEPGITYAAYAQDRLKVSYRALKSELSQLSPQCSPEAVANLAKAMATFSDLLDLFVHVLPVREDLDLYLELQADLSVGSSYIQRIQSLTSTDPEVVDTFRRPLLLWLEEFQTPQSLKVADEYMNSLNRSAATRRTIAILEKTCWGHVDFIPNLKGSYDSELRDFMRALVKAAQLSALHATTLSNISDSRENGAFYDVQNKATAIVAIADLVPEVYDQDAKLQGLISKLLQLLPRYESIAAQLKTREAYVTANKEFELSALDERIRAEWKDLMEWQRLAAIF